jgi:hypothetical protein
MCGVIDLSPGCTFIGGSENASDATYFSIGEQGWIGRSRRGFAETDDIGLRYICKLGKADAGVGRVPQTINVAGGCSSSSQPNIALVSGHSLEIY